MGKVKIRDGMLCFFRAQTTTIRPPLDVGPLFISNLVRFFRKALLTKTTRNIAYSGDSVHPHNRINMEEEEQLHGYSVRLFKATVVFLNKNGSRSNFIINIGRYI